MHHTAPRHARYDSLLRYLWIFTALLAICGLCMDSPQNILRGLFTIIMT